MQITSRKVCLHEDIKLTSENDYCRILVKKTHSKSKLLDIIVHTHSILQFLKADQVGRSTRNLTSKSSCLLVFNSSNPSIMTKQCSELSHS